MKVNLAAKNDDAKDNDPAGNFHINPECIKDKAKQQEQRVHQDGSVAQHHKTPLQPGKGQCLHRLAFVCFVRFNIPENHSYQKAGIEQKSYFREKAHG